MIGLFPEVEAMPRVNIDKCRNDLLACDVAPNPPETRLVKLAQSRGLKTRPAGAGSGHEGGAGEGVRH